jgi:GT2 family glycosyltransferase
MPGREILFVIGMHRSGTSFLAGALSRLGYALPDDIGAGATDNPEGHNESIAVCAVNDALLAAAGMTWLDARELTPAQVQRLAASPLAQRVFDALAAAFPGHGPVLVKDPRLSALLPVWRRLLEPQGYRIAVAVAARHPGAVAASLWARNRIPLREGHLAWTLQTLAALRSSESGRRALYLFPGWPGHSESVARMARLTGHSEACCARAIASAACAYRPGLDHAPSAPAFLQGREGALAAQLFARIEEWGDAGKWPGRVELGDFRSQARELTEAVRRDRGLPAARPTAALPDCTMLRADLAILMAQAVAAEAERSLLQQTIAAQERNLADLTETLLRTEGQRQEAHAMIAARLADAEALRLQVFRTEAQRDDLARRLEEERTRHEAAVAEARRVLATLEEERAGRVRDLAAAEEAMAATRREATGALASEADRRADAEARLAGAESRLVDAEASCARLAAESEALRRSLSESEAALHHASEDIGRLETALRRERLTVLRPIYRGLWTRAGRIVRQTAGHRAAEALKRRLPQPDAIPAALALPPSLPASASPLDPKDPARVPAATGCADIFVFSIIDWTFRTQRPQHLAREFAARGHRVFYVEMQKEVGGSAVRQQAEGVWTVCLGCDSGYLVATYSGRPGQGVARRWIARFESFCEAVGATAERSLVVQHPYWWDFVRHLPPENRIVFDCMDEISGFSNTTPEVIEAEHALVAGADDLVVSSEYLAAKHRGKRTVTLVRNGVSIADFRPDGPHLPPAFLAARRKPGRCRVGYVGAIAEWFDCELVRGAAEALPGTEFHLCGAVTSAEASDLSTLPNVTLHGEVPYAEVPGFIAAMDAMMIPFRLLPIIRACDPVKFYEYSAMGKPTVATALPELDRCGDLLFRAATAAGFAEALDEAVAAARDPAFRARLTGFAAANTWEDRAEAFLRAVGVRPLVSVVVLSWGSADLTLATLHSLAGPAGAAVSPAWPNLDIIVVDNGSPEAEVARIRAWAEGRSNVRLIGNGANLGFSAGNNIGIRAARGDYVLLLNNDTYVPPGAIAAMLGHLVRTPRIGVVGPLTNNIGNEARVEVAYRDMEGMVREARRLVTGHRGQWTEVRVAAFFCAMFRKADLERLDGLSEDYGLGMFEDDDLCARIRRQGQVCAVAEDAFVHHHLSASFGTLDADRRRALFARNRAIYEGRFGVWEGHRYRDTRPPGSLEAA